jgi:hypothetical protein
VQLKKAECLYPTSDALPIRHVILIDENLLVGNMLLLEGHHRSLGEWASKDNSGQETSWLNLAAMNRRKLASHCGRLGRVG